MAVMKFTGIWNKQTGLPVEQKLLSAPVAPLLIPAVCPVPAVSSRKVNLGGHIVETSAPLREREPHDFYPTPLAVCKAALDLIRFDYFVPYCEYEIFDPCAGSGPWGTAARQKLRGASIAGLDIRDVPMGVDYDDWVSSADFLDDVRFPRTSNLCDLVMANPPYKFAEEFTRKSLSLIKRGGFHVSLMRLAFLEGQARGKGLWIEHPPKSVHVLSARPSFMPEDSDKAGKTDATAYAIYVWQKGWQGVPSLGWLDWKTTQPAAAPSYDALPLSARATL